MISNDAFYMSEAIKLAQKGKGKTAPNPPVGAVVVASSGEIIGRGFHAKAGDPHAEVFAIRQAHENIKNLEGSSLYVTLEPCNHFGKTPPCVDFILESGIKKVVVGSTDSNPLMQGQSFQKLRENRVLVVAGVLQAQTDALIRGFTSVIENGRPFLTLKCAASLDGKIATMTGESKWITGEEARKRAHLERASHDAILVGVGTILKDDPSLTVRDVEGYESSLKKIILDSRLRTPPTSKIFQSLDPVIIFCDKNYSAERKAKLEACGAQVIPTESDFKGELILEDVLKKCAESEKIQDLLIEGGARILGSFIKKSLFDRVIYFMSPKILGSEGLDAFSGLKINALSESPILKNLKTQTLGSDILIEGSR